MKKVTIVLSLLMWMILIVKRSLAQDIHFSQFMSSPMNLNPALTGSFDGAYRFIGNGRSQWSSATVPYQTLGLSADANNFLRMKNVGAGLSLAQDRTGDSHFSTFLLNIAASYRINFTRKHSVSLGLQSGFTSRRIDYSNLYYDNQFNGYTYDASIPSVENFQNAGRIYANLNAGINWSYKPKKRNKVEGGFSVYNISTPKQSFFGNNFILLDQRFNIHASGQFMLSDRVDVLPTFLFMTQGTFREINGGGSFKYILNKNPNHYRALYVGASLRAGDALFGLLGMDYQKWYVGLSYDLNYSGFKPATNYRGGMEFAVIYIVDRLPKKKKYRVCPAYL